MGKWEDEERTAVYSLKKNDLNSLGTRGRGTTGEGLVSKILEEQTFGNLEKRLNHPEPVSQILRDETTGYPVIGEAILQAAKFSGLNIESHSLRDGGMEASKFAFFHSMHGRAKSHVDPPTQGFGARTHSIRTKDSGRRGPSRKTGADRYGPGSTPIRGTYRY